MRPRSIRIFLGILISATITHYCRISIRSSLGMSPPQAASGSMRCCMSMGDITRSGLKHFQSFSYCGCGPVRSECAWLSQSKVDPPTTCERSDRSSIAPARHPSGYCASSQDEAIPPAIARLLTIFAIPRPASRLPAPHRPYCPSTSCSYLAEFP